MAESKPHESAVVWMSGGYSATDILLKRAIVREGLSTLTETTIEFQSKNKSLDLKGFIGKPMRLHLIDESEQEREFQGLCISVENLGFRDGYGQYVAEVRPWAWLLTRTNNCRIFQEKTAVEIIEEVFGDHGFSDFQKRLSDTYQTREYCVQYRESDLDFVCRLLEEEGIYFYFDSNKAPSTSEKMVLCDGVNGHSPVPGEATLRYHARDNTDRRRSDHIAEWAEQESLTTGKVTLTDYDFLSPTADLKVTNAIKKGSHSHASYEVYDYPGHYRKDTGLGNKQARVRMEAEAVRHKLWRGAGSVRTLATGFTFKLKDHPDSKANKDYIIADAVHYLQVATDFKEGNLRHDLKPRNVDFPEEVSGDVYACVFGAIPKTEQFRAPLTTPWPGIPGMHTATVVGKSGEEIWTDEHGRIKVQFHWDRVGKKDENASCWVRVMTPWSGKGWGMVAVPRIGQEVVIQFEEGDPDRPICTGMLYNKDTMPPYTYPADQTQLGIKTNSSKGGGGYNELMFEDKKDSELMRVQAQKDHQMLIKNKSVVTIGQDAVDAGAHDEDGSLSQVVRNHVTQTVQEGNQYVTIEKGDEEYKIETGSQLLEIKKDKTQKIEGKHTKTITGNDATTVKTGNMTVDVKSGKITMTAAIEILLKVGGSSVKIDNSGVTIKGPIIKIQGDGMIDAKSPMTTVKGDAMLVLKGGITMIN
ncbi:MAG: type VI secretion system tip protein TssI/VgrG [Antarcticimicrobium sp.]|uniref:type VI secretion system Vgr family protein n=1 Tax=Antarcticimicrobium sp. TaxID=2824147 RepID=UPI00260A5C3B|nr:type VI secretion system tip protein TssI/VgrG [Antarcticimicrobium sp.]MDF1718411.1 type VI secretion system tip protein TssI/VgrG [Antarcticimicrobium sp.]